MLCLSLSTKPLTHPPIHVFPSFLFSLVWLLCLNLHNEDEVMAVIFSSQCLSTCNPPQSPRLTNRHTMPLCKASAVMPIDDCRLLFFFFFFPHASALKLFKSHSSLEEQRCLYPGLRTGQRQIVKGHKSVWAEFGDGQLSLQLALCVCHRQLDKSIQFILGLTLKNNCLN